MTNGGSQYRSPQRRGLGLFTGRPGVRASSWMPPMLYATFALALVALARPQLFEGIERRLMQWASIPVRAFVGREVAAAEVVELRDERRAEMQVGRFLRNANQLIPDKGPMHEASLRRGLRPVLARVIERRGGGLGERPQELVLDLRERDLIGFERFVTRDNVLLGFLASSPVPQFDRDGRPDPLSGHLRISLLHRNDRSEPLQRVPVSTSVNGRELVFLVEPASTESRFPLHCHLFSDQHLATDLVDDSAQVVTHRFDDDPAGALPAGLEVGRLRVYGYNARSSARAARQVVPIDYFVEPPREASVVSQVVLWAKSRGPEPRLSRPLEGVAKIPVALLRFSVPSAGSHRFLASTRAGRRLRLPRDAAVVRGERLLGFVDAAGVDFGVVAPLGEPGREMSLVIVPSGGTRSPVAVRAVCLGREGNIVELRTVNSEPVPTGQAFTGADGLNAPAGLWIGPVLGDAPGKMRATGMMRIAHVDPQAMSERAEVLSWIPEPKEDDR